MDLLFSQIETWNNKQPWGSVLDAGTGQHSLRWLSGLQTERWTAVTGDINRAKALQLEFNNVTRSCDRICFGNWQNDQFLNGEIYDVVIADYLLGAIDGFTPYFQRNLFSRLKRHVGHRLYVVGLEPIPHYSPDTGGKIITEIANLRDAHIRLANHRCYREYPMNWVKETLIASDYDILKSARFPIRYQKRTINRQLNVCIQKLPFIKNESLRVALKSSTEALRNRAMKHIDAYGPISFGFDYLICAKPKHL